MTEIFVINYAKASEIQPTLASLVDTTAGGKIVIDARTNSLVITERPSRMKRIRPVIEQLDRPTDQVMIESKFVEIANNDIKNIGVNWSSLSGYQITATPGSQGFYSYSNTYGSSLNNGISGNSGTTGNTTNSTGNTGSTTLSNGSNGSSSVTSTNGSNGSSSVTSTNGAVTSTSTTGTNNSIANTLGNTLSNAVSTGISNSTNVVNQVAGSGTSSNMLAAVFSADQFKLVLAALQQLNDSKIVSNPTVVTLNNTEAQINVGQQY